jgi:hypothetical protein
MLKKPNDTQRHPKEHQRRSKNINMTPENHQRHPKITNGPIYLHLPPTATNYDAQ